VAVFDHESIFGTPNPLLFCWRYSRNVHELYGISSHGRVRPIAREGSTVSSSAFTSELPVPAPRRPIGLVLAAVVLALMTCMGFFSGLVSIFAAVFIRTPQMAQYQMIEGIQIGMGIVWLLISGFCAWTVVELFRVKNWARITMLIFGGLLAFFSLLLVVLFCAMAFLAPIRESQTPGVSAAMMKVMLLGIGSFYLLFALVGVWWLVYFNLRRIRALFAENGARLQPRLLSQAPVPVGGVWIDASRPKRGAIEILVICLGVLYLFGAFEGIVEVFVRFPIFLPGYILRGNSASAVALVFAVFELGLGVGLLRKVRAAWVAAIAFNVLGLIYIPFMFSPHSRALMASYQQEIMHRMFSGILPYPAMDQAMLGPAYFFGAIVGVLGVGAVIWLLLLARPLFDAKRTVND